MLFLAVTRLILMISSDHRAVTTSPQICPSTLHSPPQSVQPVSPHLTTFLLLQSFLELNELCGYCGLSLEEMKLTLVSSLNRRFLVERELNNSATLQLSKVLQSLNFSFIGRIHIKAASIIFSALQYSTVHMLVLV